MKLDAAQHFAWLILRRVKAGGIARHDDHYLEHGRPVGSYACLVGAAGFEPATPRL
ncbi:MAG: hypothetical protein ACRDTE_10470 [Pseudonocardiaceae bacterium]